MKTYTKQEKSKYFSSLRQRWQESKKLAETDKMQAIIREVEATGLKVSPYSIVFTAIEMEAKKLDGLPVVDAKTFYGWKSSGYKVKKGSKSVISGVTWVKANEGEDEKESYVMPKVYRLFHRSQVEKI